jgi:hypothetical protein
MLITIDFYVLLVMILAMVGAIGFTAMWFLQLKQYAPESFRLRYARLHKTGLVFLFHANGTFEIEVPKYDTNPDANYYYIKGRRYKFKDMSGDRTHRLNGDIPVWFVLDELPEPISALMAAHFDHLCEILEARGLSIDGIYDLFVYSITEVFKEQPLLTRKGATWKDLNLDEQVIEIQKRLEEVLTEIDVNDEATRAKLAEVMAYIQRNKAELEQAVKLMHPRPFSLQRFVAAMASIIGLSSSNLYNAIQTVEADAKNTRGIKDMMPIIVVGFLVFIILIAFGVLTK